MNIFNRIVGRERAGETTLGNPLRRRSAIERRMNYFANLTGGRGFREYPREPQTDAQGKTRGQRKRELRARTIVKMKEQANG